MYATAEYVLINSAIMDLASLKCGVGKDADFRPIFTKAKLVQDLEEAISAHHCDIYMTKDTWEVFDDDVERYCSHFLLCRDMGVMCCTYGSKKGICHHCVCDSFFGFHLASVIQGCN